MCNSNNSNDHKVEFESLDTIEQSLIEEDSQYPNDFNEYLKIPKKLP